LRNTNTNPVHTIKNTHTSMSISERLRQRSDSTGFLRLTKSPQTFCCRRERRLPLKNIPLYETSKCQIRNLNSGGLRGATTLLTIQPHVGSQGLRILVLKPKGCID
jgi:hypothetical protein